MSGGSRTAVCDASPLIVLAKAGLLDLLQFLAPPIQVPVSVVEEIRAKGTDDPASRALGLREMFSIVEDPPIDEQILGRRLGLGESAVIAQCLREGKSCFALLDDRAARRCAQDLGVAVVGTAGLVVAARRRGHIEDVSTAIRRLIDSGLFLSDDLIRHIVELSG